MKKILLISLVLLSAITGFTQGPPPPPDMDDEKVEALRIAFLTKYLELTTDEAQKFWPVYNQMRAELKVVMDKEMALQKGKSINDMTDDELNKLIQAHFDNEQTILDIKKKYAEEFKKVLPLRKVAMLADAENEFKREVLRHYREKQGPGGPGGGPGGHPEGEPGKDF